MDRPLDLAGRDDAVEELPEGGLIEGGERGEAAGHEPVFQWREAPALDKHTRVSLRMQEREVAAKYMSDPRQMRIYTVVTLACFALWLASFPLTILDITPIWPWFLFATFIAAVGYVPSHEAMHRNIGRPGTKYHFWNELVGQVATIILIFPFSMARMMHMHHHYHTNHPENDPDYTDGADNSFKAWIKTWLNRQPGADGSIHHYKRCLERPCLRGRLPVLAAAPHRPQLYPLLAELGAAPPARRARPLHPHPRVPRPGRALAFAGDAVPHRAPPLSRHPQPRDQVRVLRDEAGARAARGRLLGALAVLIAQRAGRRLSIQQ